VVQVKQHIFNAMIFGTLLAPLLALFLHTFSEPLPDPIVHGDLATIELFTLRAADLEQLTGPYSRLKFHHPGPALFYWLAPFHVAFGQRYGALPVGALTLNALAFLVLALVPWRLAGVRALVLAAPALALVLLYQRAALLWSIWNPDTGILPFAASVACAFAIASGRWSFLPAGCFLGSFAAQCHVVLVPPLASVWVVALVLAWRKGSAPSLRRWPLAAAGAVFALVWLPVVVEELLGEPGNLTAILGRIAAGDGDKQSFQTTLAAGSEAAAEAFFAPLGFGGFQRLDAVHAGQSRRLAGLLLAAGTVLAWVAWRRRSPRVPATALCLAVLLISSFYALHSLTGVLHTHLTRWMVMLGPLIWIFLACAWAAAPETPRAEGRYAWRARLGDAGGALAFAATLLLSLATLLDIGRMPPLGPWIEKNWGTGAHGHAVEKVVHALDEQGIHAPYLGILDDGYWHYATAIVDRLAKRGRHAVLYADWEYMFGAPSLHGVHDGLLLLSSTEESHDPADVPRGAAVVEEYPIYATLIPLPAAFGRGARQCILAGDDDAEHFLRWGFYDVERGGDEPASRWSRFGSSALSVRLHPERAYRLTFEACPFEGAMPQAIVVTVNGQALPEVAMAPGWQRYAVPLPPAAVLALNDVILRYRQFVIPAQTKLSDDPRALAVHYRSLCFEEL
jgi:hypothetical protein